jgi:hypothetical protein
MSTEILNGQFGVDKLKLFTNQFVVDDTKHLEIIPNRKKAGNNDIEHTPLFNSDGEIITGEKAFLNSKDYNVTIKNGLFYLEFNPSKFYDSVKLTTDPNKIADRLTTIKNDLKDNYKIDVELMSTGISRIDMTAQSKMVHLCNDYRAIISGGKKTLRFQPTEYPDGYLTGNTQRQLCQYDKGLKQQIDQLKERGITKRSTLQPTNFIRLESRLLKSTSVKSHSQFKDITHLLNGNIDQYKHLYSKCVNDLLRIEQPQIEFIEIAVLTDLVRTAYTTQARGQWLLFVVMSLNKYSDLPSIDQFNETLKRLQAENVISKGYVSKMIKQYQSMVHQTRFASNKYFNDKSDNYVSMYNEIQDKLILPYKAI